ncbi:hypothetical protein ACQJBY_002893 [Aegilops geniculata]
MGRRRPRANPSTSPSPASPISTSSPAFVAPTATTLSVYPVGSTWRQHGTCLPSSSTMGDSSSASYIRMVHHLIEKCICFNLNKEGCMEALEKHAKINPVVTATVWKELEKENKEFFESYNRDRVERNIEAATMERIQKMLSDAAASKTSDDDEG